MRAGALDRQIVIERVATGTSATGAVTEAWATFATLRGHLDSAKSQEVQRALGASSETALVFKARYVPGITLADRVQYDGAAYNIVGLAEVGRRVGLEISCVKVG